MMSLQKSNDVLIITREDKNKLFYDLFGLTMFTMLGIALLIDPKLGQSLTGTDLAGAWFTALGGIMLCSTLLFTKEHTRVWSFDKASSSIIIQCKTLIYCRKFTTPFEHIQSVKKTYLKNNDTEIIIDVLDSYPIEIKVTPDQKADEHVKIIKNFLNFAD